MLLTSEVDDMSHDMSHDTLAVVELLSILLYRKHKTNHFWYSQDNVIVSTVILNWLISFTAVSICLAGSE